MRKMILVSLVSFIAVVGLTPHVFAQGFVPLAGIPGLTEGVNTTSSGLPVFFNNLYKYLIGLAAALAVIMIIWGGLEISTQDSVSKKSDGKERIKQALFGLVLVLSPVLVFSIINPSILNLSLNLPELDTKSGSVQNTPAPYIQQPGSTRPGTLSAARDGTCIAFSEGGYTAPQPCAYCYQLKTPLSATDPINNNQGSVANYMCSNSSNGCRILSNSFEAVDNSICAQQVPSP